MYKMCSARWSHILDVMPSWLRWESLWGWTGRAKMAGGIWPHCLLFKMFCKGSNYDGIQYVSHEIKGSGPSPTWSPTTLCRKQRAKLRTQKPSLARSLLDEIFEAGLIMNGKTSSGLEKIHKKVRWGRDVMKFKKKMRSSAWSMDLILYNITVDLGLEEVKRLWGAKRLSRHRTETY